jgi:hypothetical protein
MRRKLTPEARVYIDRVTAEIWSEAGDVAEAERLTMRTLEMQGRQLGFDPATILMLVQLAILVYKALKYFNVLSPTPELVSALFEGDEE